MHIVKLHVQYHKTACTSLPEDEHLFVRNLIVDGNWNAATCVKMSRVINPYPANVENMVSF